MSIGLQTSSGSSGGGENDDAVHNAVGCVGLKKPQKAFNWPAFELRLAEIQPCNQPNTKFTIGRG
jgi:hypothetical protein